MNSELKTIYEEKCSASSDINEHLPVLKDYASKCDVVVEAGVRWATSTWGLMAGLPKKLISVDIEHVDSYSQSGGIERIKRIANENGVDFEFRLQSTVPDSTFETLNLSNDDVDLLFIDTYHSYEHLKLELDIHAKYIKKYLIFHDTTLFGNELNPAINEYMKHHPEWKIEKVYTNNNGLTILKREN